MTVLNHEFLDPDKIVTFGTLSAQEMSRSCPAA
jgi:hypothetical protein